MAELQRITALEAEGSPFWLGLARRVLLDGPHAVVVGRPSAELGRRKAAAEKARAARARCRSRR